VVAAIVAAGCSFAVVQFLEERTSPILALCLGALVMGLLYVSAGGLLRITEIRQLVALAHERFATRRW
jgi:hypothetical protein